MCFLSPYLWLGVSEDITLTASGKGHVRGGRAGDLLIHFSISPSSTFERKGIDIYSKISIDLYTALLGGEVEVPTIHGNVMLRITEGTQPNDVKKLTGKGIQNQKTGRFGNHYVTILIDMPKYRLIS